MTFLERLKSHKGSLIKLETELYWYGGRSWDGNPGRVCLLLDASFSQTDGDARRSAAVRTATSFYALPALLLIDGSPKWVWVNEEDVELL